MFLHTITCSGGRRLSINLSHLENAYEMDSGGTCFVMREVEGHRQRVFETDHPYDEVTSVLNQFNSNTY